MSQQVLVAKHNEPKLKLASYVYGFGLSIFFTLLAYLLVTHHAASRDTLVGLVIAFAFCQFIVQLLCFLHLGQETRPRWKLAVFFFMIGVVLILVFGSLWIINNLNYRMTIPKEIQYINSQDNL